MRRLGLRPPPAIRRLVPLAASTGLFILTFGSTLRGFLVQDDFWWLNRARDALGSPLMLFAPMGGFVRPLATWTWVASYLAWADSPVGHHFFNLVLQWLCGVLLFSLLRRWGFGPWLAALLASIWWVSPYALEATVSCSARFDSLLLASWLGMALAWPAPGARWTESRAAAVATLTVLAMASKESWVVTPGWFFTLEVVRGNSSLRSAVRVAGCALVAALAYTALYLRYLAPTVRGFYELSLQPVAKLAVIAASFLQVAPLQAGGFELGWDNFLGVGVFAALILGAACLKRRYAAAGLTLAALSLLPTLMSPFLPQRWCLTAYAGFLVFAGDLAIGVAALPGRVNGRRLVASLAFATGAVVLVSELVATRLDLSDYRRLDDAHRQLVAEARQVLPLLPRGTPIVLVRAENINPLLELARTLEGVPKTLFQRGTGPYGLITGTWLFDYVGIREHLRAGSIEKGAYSNAVRHTLVLHLAGRFDVRPPTRPSMTEEVESWRSSGFPVETLILQ